MRPRKLTPLPYGLTFNAIDVETANYDQSTICQIGVVSVVNGRIRDEWETLVDPEDEIHWFFTNIHGISDDDVWDAPILPDVWGDLHRMVRDELLISHTNFDRNALNKAAAKYGMNNLRVQWDDSCAIAKRAWPRMPGGHNLENLAKRLGIRFNHHNALEDARAAATVVLRAYGV